MHIDSGLNTVSSMYRQQKGNNMKAPVSAEKTFFYQLHLCPNGNKNMSMIVNETVDFLRTNRL